jgi:hypothetical protein
MSWQEDADALDQMVTEKGKMELENAEVIKQMEEDTDQEIEDLKIMYGDVACLLDWLNSCTKSVSFVPNYSYSLKFST